MAAPLVRCGCTNFVKRRLFYGARNLCQSAVLHQNTISSTTEDHEGIIPPASSHSGAEDQIVMPKRKKRDKLSILNALASTVKTDFNAPLYTYMDDPYLMPTRMITKRTFALAKASGKEAARYVLEKYPGDFANNPAEPNIEAFNPPISPQLAEDTEEGLLERIERKEPMLAYQSYQRVQEAGVTVSPDTLDSLLDLLCAYNSAERKPAPHLELRFLQRDLGSFKRTTQCTWSQDGLAEQLFKEMKSPSVAAYRSMIRGRAKNYQVNGALDLFNEMKKNKLPVGLETYNAVLGISPFLRDDPQERWKAVLDIMRELAENGLTPNLTTFNNLLGMAARSRFHSNSLSWVMQILNEMKHCGIEPSLASWTYALIVCYPNEETHECPILGQILQELEGKDIKLRDPKDLSFFIKAMSLCFEQKDMESAHKLDKILNHGTNIDLLGDSFHYSVYYTQYLRMLCIFEQIDTIMEHYERMTPHVYVPTFNGYMELLRALDLNEGYQYLPKIWSDFAQFQYSKRTDLVQELLAIVAKEKHEEPLQGMLLQIVRSVKEQYEMSTRPSFRGPSRKPMELTGPMISNLAQTHLNAGFFDEAWNCMEIFLAGQNRIEGLVSETCLMNLAEICQERKDMDKLMAVLSIMSRFAHPKLDMLADKVMTEMDPTDEQRNHIEDLL